MNKENFLFAFIGLIAGLVIGFMFANSVNRNASSQASLNPSGMMSQNSNMPAGHPDISGGGSTQTGGSTQSMESMPEIQQAIDKAKNEPDNFEAQLKAAQVYYQINRFDTAIELLQKANKLKPDDYDTIVLLGNAHFDAEKYEDAEKWYGEALKKKTDDVAVRTDMGLTFVLRPTPDYDRAIKEFTRSLEINPKHIQTLQNLTVAYTKKGDAAKANETLAKVEAIDPTNQALGRLREEIGKIQK